MLYWECKRRLALLRQFRALASDYFANIEYADWMDIGGEPTVNEKSQRARNEINHMMHDAQLSFDLLGLPHTLVYTPPPMVGGYRQNVDVVGNMFDLWQFQLGRQVVFDSTDRAIGAYERERRALLRKSFNPLYWLGMLIAWVLRLPFKLLGAAGYDATTIEASGVGKAFKLVWGLIVGVATIVPAAFEIHDRWDKIRGFLHR
jgi:hypothetical protein